MCQNDIFRHSETQQYDGYRCITTISYVSWHYRWSGTLDARAVSPITAAVDDFHTLATLFMIFVTSVGASVVRLVSFAHGEDVITSIIRGSSFKRRTASQVPITALVMKHTYSSFSHFYPWSALIFFLRSTMKVSLIYLVNLKWIWFKLDTYRDDFIGHQYHQYMYPKFGSMSMWNVYIYVSLMLRKQHEIWSRTLT
jgi:hypothetical protein